MARQKNVVSSPVQVIANVDLVQFAEIIWHQPFNLSRTTLRSAKQAIDLREALAISGIKTTLDRALIFDQRSKIWGSEHNGILNVVMGQRQETWDTLKGNVTSEEQRIDLEEFEKCYTDGKGNLLIPKYFGNSWFSRSNEIPAAMVMRRKGFLFHPKDNDESIQYEPADTSYWVPVSLKVYDSEIERLYDQSDENQLKNHCNVSPGAYDNLVFIKRIRELNVLMTDREFSKVVREKFPGTVGQRNVQLLKLESLWRPENTDRFPGEQVRGSLELVSRCNPKLNLSKVTKSTYLKLETFNKTTTLTEWIDRSIPSELAKRNEKISLANKEATKKGLVTAIQAHLEPIKSLETMENELQGLMKGQSGSSSPLSPDKYKQLVGKPNKLVSDLANGHLNKDEKPLGFLLAHTDALNPVYDALVDNDDAFIRRCMAQRKNPAMTRFLDLVEKEKPKKVEERLA